MKEEWRDVKGFEGSYQVSDLGRVKSLDRTIKRKNGILHPIKGSILTPTDDGKGYLKVSLSLRNKNHAPKVHSLVAVAFLNHEPDGTSKISIDHINGDKKDNRKENLRLMTHRENCVKRSKIKKGTSDYEGVCWDKNRGKWMARIYVDRKNIHLGRFNKEEDAGRAYQDALIKYNI